MDCGESSMRKMRKWFYKLFIECSPLQGYVAHLPHGIINVFLATHVDWTIALLFGGGYILFQLNQEKAGFPPAHYDLAGWLLGLCIGGGIYVVFF